jgi:hypothetical protein
MWDVDESIASARAKERADEQPARGVGMESDNRTNLCRPGSRTGESEAGHAIVFPNNKGPIACFLIEPSD